MCITRAKHINHSAFHHSPLACIRFGNDKQREKGKDVTVLVLLMCSNTRFIKIHLWALAIGSLNLLSLVLTEWHRFSGHVLHWVSPWSNSWRQLLELVKWSTPMFMTCMCQICYMHAVHPCCVGPLCA